MDIGGATPEIACTSPVQSLLPVEARIRLFSSPEDTAYKNRLYESTFRLQSYHQLRAQPPYRLQFSEVISPIFSRGGLALIWPS